MSGRYPIDILYSLTKGGPGRDTLDGRAQVLHTLDGCGDDRTIWFPHTHERDLGPFVRGVVSEEKLSEHLYSGLVLNPDAHVLLAEAGAILLESIPHARLLDDDRFVRIVGSGGRLLRQHDGLERQKREEQTVSGQTTTTNQTFLHDAS